MDSQEIWKDINGYEGYYQVSNLGLVRSLDRIGGPNNKTKLIGRQLKLRIGSHGYYIFSVSKLGKVEKQLLHRVLAVAFISNPENKRCVNHKDGDKRNNRIDIDNPVKSNLEWCTHKENSQHCIKNKLQIIMPGEEHPAAKLSKKDVLEIRKSNRTPTELSIKYGVKPATISNIKARRIWKHL